MRFLYDWEENKKHPADFSAGCFAMCCEEVTGFICHTEPCNY